MAFDLQKCPEVEMLLHGKIPILLEYTGPKDLSQYILKDLKIKKVLIEEIKRKLNPI